MLFRHLVLLPHRERPVRARRLVLPEDVRMAGDELFGDFGNDVRHVEIARLFLHEGMEDRLHQHVARLLAHALGVLSVDGVYELVRLLDEVDADGLVRLHPIPRAAVGRAQAAHDGNKIVEIEPLLFQERDIEEDERRFGRITFGAVSLIERDALRLLPVEKKRGRLVAEAVAKQQLDVARKQLVVEVVHDKGQRKLALCNFIGRDRRIAPEQPRPRRRGRRLGDALKDGDAALLDKKLRRAVLGDAAVHAVTDIPLRRALSDFRGKIFCKRIEIAALFVDKVEAFERDVKLFQHPSRRERCGAHQHAARLLQAVDRPERELPRARSQTDDRDHIVPSSDDDYGQYRTNREKKQPKSRH